MDMKAAALPAFIELPGNSVGRIPYRATGATMHGFVFKADRHILQRTCDRCITDPGEGKVRFIVAAPYVLLTALYVERMSSADPIDKSKGFVRETDIGFWIPVVGGCIEEPTRWRLRWLPTYMFVDSGSALSAGREVFGYPKSLAIVRPPDEASAVFSIDTEHFERFAPDAEGRVQPLFGIAGSGPAARQAASCDELASMLWTLFEPGLGRDPDVAPFSGDEFLPYVGMPMIFLKQFREHRYPGKACYRTITTVTVKPTRFLGGEVLTPSFRLEIKPSASHPIAADLGIGNGDVPSLAIAVSMNFDVGFAETLAAIKE